MIKKIRQKLKEGILREMYRELKWLLGYTKQYTLSIIVFIMLGVVSSLMGLGSNVASKYLIDAVTGFDAVGIVPAVCAMGGLMAGNILVQSLYNRYSTVLDVKIKAELKSVIYDKIMRVRWQSVQEYRSGDLMTRLNSDANTVSSGATGFIPNLITNGVRFLGAFVIIMLYDPVMAVIALISVPLSGIVSRLLIRKIRQHNKTIKELDSEIMSFSEDSMGNIQTLKAFGLGGLFGVRFSALMDRFKKENLDYNRFTVLCYAAMSAIGMLVYACCFGWGVYRLWSGVITYGTMTLFLSMSSYLQGSFSGLISLVPGIISASTSAGRLMDILGLPDEEYTYGDELDGDMSVELDKVCFAYKTGRQVLTDFDFAASPGETVAVIGPSGEGKTTLIRVMLGLVMPSKGRAVLKSGDRQAAISAATRRYIAYVPQGNTLFAGTIADNLRLVKENATDNEIIEALETACAWEFVKELPEGINSQVGERGVKLSEGQAQRVSIARAIIKDSPVMLLDEATSALDVDTERRLLENLRKAKIGRTCIMTTHRTSVYSICDRVYTVRDLPEK